MTKTGELRTYRLDERAYVHAVGRRMLVAFALVALVVAGVTARAGVPDGFSKEASTALLLALVGIGCAFAWRRAMASARATAASFVLAVGPNAARRTMPGAPDVEVSRDRIVDVRAARGGIRVIVRGGPELFVPASLIDYADACERFEAWRRERAPVAPDELARELAELRTLAPASGPPS